MYPSFAAVICSFNCMFDVLNDKFFDSQLPSPVITVYPDVRKAYGWCTTVPVWNHRGSDVKYYEINITAEYLNRSSEELVGTMLHEMVHLYNSVNGVKDTSRSGTYHNKKFYEAAVSHGLTCEFTDKYGYSKTALNFSFDSLNFPAPILNSLYRDPFKTSRITKSKCKSSTRKYVCPCCGDIIRATKRVVVRCESCNELFEEQF